MLRIDVPLSYIDRELAALESLAVVIAEKISPYSADVCAGCECNIPVVNGIRNTSMCPMFKDVVPF